MRFQKTPFALAVVALCGAMPQLGAQTASTAIEAEGPSVTRSNYAIEGSRIKVTTTSVTGTATTKFNGTTGTYNIQVHVLLENDGRPTLEVWKGTTDKLYTYLYPSGTTAASFTVTGVQLNTGDVIRLVGKPNSNAYARVDKIVLTKVADAGTGSGTGYQGTPFSGTPIALPKAFAAADFDHGGRDVAYRDLSNGNTGGQYRTSEHVDITTSTDAQGGPYAVTNFQTGEWMAYTVNVPTSRAYDLAIRAASNQTTPGSFHIEVDGVNVTGPVAVPNTGGWSTYQWFGKQGINLTAGKRVIKVVSDQQFFNINALSVLESGASQSGVSFKQPAANAQLAGTISQSAACEVVGSGIAKVQFALDSTPLNLEGSAPWQCDIDTRKFSDGAHTLKATATLSDGKTALAQIPVTIKNNTSTPTTSQVSFKAPAANAQLSGTIGPSAACEVVGTGITKVQFSLDSTPLNLEGSAPWNCIIDTRKFSDGAHTLKALATLSDGKTALAQIPVTIKNNVSSPGPSPSPYSVSFKTPAANQELSGIISQATACEAVGTGITKVQFSLGSTPLNLEGTAPWQCNIDTTKFANGTHMLKAQATYADGKSGLAEIPVTIKNGSTTSASTGTPNPVGADFFCSFENSPRDCGFGEQAKAAGRATLVDNPRRHGAKAVRLHTEPGDNNVSGSGTGERNDLGLPQAATDCYQGREHWWAHSTLLPNDFVAAGGGSLIMDFHHTGSHGQANFQIVAWPDGLKLQGAGGPTVAFNSRDPGVYTAHLGPVVKNQWYDFVYHVKWSSGSDGFMDVWVNGVKKLAHRGPTLYTGMGCYLKIANYHAPTGLPNSVIHDRVVRGKSAAAVSLTPLQ